MVISWIEGHRPDGPPPLQWKKTDEPVEEGAPALEFTGLHTHRRVKRWDGGRTDPQPTVAR